MQARHDGIAQGDDAETEGQIASAIQVGMDPKAMAPPCFS